MKYPAPKSDDVIVAVRGRRVILDSDLARIYRLPTFRFNESVKRNLTRFPSDFMFRLSLAEWKRLQGLRSQIAMLKPAIHASAIVGVLQRIMKILDPPSV
jgi:hypothetical protein